MSRNTSRSEGNAGTQAPNLSVPKAEIKQSISDVSDYYELAASQCQGAIALIDAAMVLCALERSPVHQDSHPSFDIRTGGGYARGLRLKKDTLPRLLEQATYLIESSINDADVMRERATNALNQLAAEGEQS
jgi:hypothetical protein